MLNIPFSPFFISIRITTFGKYKGQSIQYIINQDRQYVKWLCSQKWYEENYNPLYRFTIEALEDNKLTKIEKDKINDAIKAIEDKILKIKLAINKDK